MGEARGCNGATQAARLWAAGRAGAGRSAHPRRSPPSAAPCPAPPQGGPPWPGGTGRHCTGLQGGGGGGAAAAAAGFAARRGREGRYAGRAWHAGESGGRRSPLQSISSRRPVGGMWPRPTGLNQKVRRYHCSSSTAVHAAEQATDSRASAWPAGAPCCCAVRVKVLTPTQRQAAEHTISHHTAPHRTTAQPRPPPPAPPHHHKLHAQHPGHKHHEVEAADPELAGEGQHPPAPRCQLQLGWGGRGQQLSIKQPHSARFHRPAACPPAPPSSRRISKPA